MAWFVLLAREFVRFGVVTRRFPLRLPLCLSHHPLPAAALLLGLTGSSGFSGFVGEKSIYRKCGRC
jgi:hypothetical protein